MFLNIVWESHHRIFEPKELLQQYRYLEFERKSYFGIERICNLMALIVQWWCCTAIFWAFTNSSLSYLPPPPNFHPPKTLWKKKRQANTIILTSKCSGVEVLLFSVLHKTKGNESRVEKDQAQWKELLKGLNPLISNINIHILVTVVKYSICYK